MIDFFIIIYFCIDDNKTTLAKKLFEFSQNKNSEDEISKEYGVKSSSDFNIKKAQTELSQVDLNKEIIKCGYRPFETKYIYFDRIVVDRPRKELLIHSKNISKHKKSSITLEELLTKIEEFDKKYNGGIEINPNQHIPFQSGPRRCLGEHMA